MVNVPLSRPLLATVSTRYSLRMNDVVVLAITSGEAPQFREGIWRVARGLAEADESRAVAEATKYLSRTILMVLRSLGLKA